VSLAVLKARNSGRLRRFARLVTGVGLVLLGLLGLMLPILPGWIFLIPGLLILSDFCPRLRRLVGWAKAKAAQAQAEWWTAGRKR